MRSLVSVIIPAYNAAEYIAGTIESVLSQTYRDHEIIVVNDGSGDDTKERLAPYMGKIKYIEKRNGGAASARNVGMRNADGEYLAFLDSDDMWLPDKLAAQIGLFDADGAVSAVFSDRINIHDAGREDPVRASAKFVSDDMFFNIWWNNPITTSTFIAKRSCFEMAGAFDESSDIGGAEDCEMWLRIARKCKIAYIARPLAKYRVRMKGDNRSNIERSYNASRLVIERHWASLEASGHRQGVYKRRMHKFYKDRGFSLLWINNIDRARESFSRALRYNPFDIKIILYCAVLSLPEKKLLALRKMKRGIFKNA